MALGPDGTDTWIVVPAVAYAGISTCTCWPVGAATSIDCPGCAPSGICTSITRSPGCAAMMDRRAVLVARATLRFAAGVGKPRSARVGS